MIDSDKNSSASGRIPIRFVDEEESNRKPESGAGSDNTLTPDEIGRASSYEEATEVQRRVDRGAEEDGSAGREQADDADTAGGPNPAELPQSRTDKDTVPTTAADEPPARKASSGSDAGSTPSNAAASGAAAAAGPMIAELVATRAELKRVETELQKLNEERQQLNDTIARRQADFDNYRKRVERERGETYHRTVSDVVSQLLPVVDNLQRALAAEKSLASGESEEFRHFLQGVELISKQLNSVLEKLGVEPVPTVGQPFDPHVHEAVSLEETDQYEPNTVIEEMVRGYRLGDKLVRPAMVKVAK